MRAAIYSRVSSEEQIDGYSLDAQEHAARQLADLRGWQVWRIYREPGRSGKSALRPEFQQLISDAERGAFDVIIVHKLDRFSRSLVDILTYLQRLDRAGVAFVSVTEAFDFSTPSGRLFLTMIGAFAEWYLGNLAQEISKGKKERARQGGWNGQLSWGYTTPGQLQKRLLALGEAFKAGNVPEQTYSAQAKLFEDALETYSEKDLTSAIPDPVNAPGVKMMFEQYATGRYSDRDIASLLNDKGYKAVGRAGRDWFSKETVADMLQNRFYVGQTSYGVRVKGARREYIQGEHQPLISRDIFERAQHIRQQRGQLARTNVVKRSQKRIYMLGSVLTCLCCGSRLNGHLVRGKARYEANTRLCQSNPKSIEAEWIEAEIGQLVAALSLPDDWRARITCRLESDDVPKLDQKAIEGRLRRLQEVYIDGGMSKAEYERRRDQLREQLTRSPLSSVHLESMATLLKDVGRLWQHATTQERKLWVQMLFRTVYVQDGHIKAAEPTPLLWVLLDHNGVIGLAGRTGFEPAIGSYEPITA